MQVDRVVLASASPRRKELLEQVGIHFDIIVSDVEEVITKTHPDEVVCELSQQKAEAVFGKLERKDNVLVIGADTVVSIDGKILGKPKNSADAEKMLRLLAGREHSVYTGVTLRSDGVQHTFAEETKVNVYSMSDRDISRYIATKEPFDKAGAYGIQGLFAAYVQGIIGDYNNVVGLPIGRICEELRRMQYEVQGMYF